MDIKNILILISYSAALILLFTIPLRRRAVLLRAGKKVLDLGKRGELLLKSILMVLLCAALIFVIKIRNFSVFVEIAFCGTAVLGCELAVRELSLFGLNGVFSNGIILGLDFVDFDDIAAFPVLQLPAEEQKNYPKNVLVVATRSRGRVELIFSSEELCKKAVEQLFTLRPDLRSIIS